MIFYVNLTFTAPLPYAPSISSIWLDINGKEYCATWDEASYGPDKEQTNFEYRLKGVSFFDSETEKEDYANDFFHADNMPEKPIVKVTDVRFDDDEVWEQFEEEEIPVIEEMKLVIWDNEVKIPVPSYTEVKKTYPLQR